MVREYTKDTTADELVKDLAGEIANKVVLVTGVSQGTLGGIFLEYIVKANPSRLILAGRTLSKAQQTADALKAAHPDIDIRTLQVDLSSLADVRDAAAKVNSWGDVPHIDVLVNNAGIMAIPHQVTVDGFEMQFGSNHLGPFLFTNLIMDKILASKAPRIVNVSSSGHRLNPIRFFDYNFGDGETYNRWQAYGQSKTANMLMAVSLAEKLGSRGLTAFSLHPGTIMTHLGEHIDFSVEFATLAAADRLLGNAEGWLTEFDFKTPDRGVATHIYAAFEPSLKEVNGVYLEDAHVADPFVQTVKPWGTSKVEAERLWKLSEKLVGQEFTY
ncbi:Short-chain dehydrogenase/reductase [Trichoderma parareesei]|uniref:Short-chain dehydrogenase/reductase n=1 Tax=Trichoderma parareesei TaxID=858221 RepID=A0A2H3A104_TRIPA|nr:Short-chain dehydrogenase/reductase [Trichoderma parareesei]